MKMNMHFKDENGRHRIVSGDLDFINDQKSLRTMLKSMKIRPSNGPILGVIRGGKFKTPDRFAIPSA